MKNVLSKMASPHVYKVGALIMFSTAVIIVSVFLIGERQGLMRHHYCLFAPFENVSGLQPGAAVRVAGYRVGVVEDVRMNHTPALVKLILEKRFQNSIRHGSVARISSAGLLGDRIIEITTAAGDQPALQNGEMIATTVTMPTEEILTLVSELSDNMRSAAVSLNVTVKKVEQSTGSLGKFLEDPRFHTDLDSLIQAVVKLENDIQHNKGIAGTLFTNHALYDSLDRMAVKTSEMTNALTRNQNAFGVLLMDPHSYEELLATAQKLDEALCQIEQGGSTLGVLSSNISPYDDATASLQKFSDLIRDVRNNPRKYVKSSLRRGQ